MSSEPHGHRGRPAEYEVRAARNIAPRLGATVVLLRLEGFSHNEATMFLAGLAYSNAETAGETWHSPMATKSTIEGIMIGRAAKEWSIVAIIAAMDQVSEMLDA